MISNALDSPRFRDIAPPREDIGCESGSEIVSRLRDADAVKWTVSWKSGFDRWITHEIIPPIEAEGDFIALAALLHDAGQTLSLHELEQISIGRESRLTHEIRELVGALRSNFPKHEAWLGLLGDSPAISQSQAQRLHRCLAGYTWSTVKARTKDDVRVLDSFTGRVERIDEDVACVRFVDAEGRISFAQIDTVDLVEQGLGEGDSFVCEIKAKNGETTMILTAVPKKQLSDADYAEIDRKLDEALPDSLFDENK